MQNAIIIFVRNPQLGKVKTRLAATIGNEKALSIYKYLLNHTFTITQNIDAIKYVFYHEQIVQQDSWSHNGFIKKIQANENLGTKMEKAFTEVFNENFNKVLIIGSDCLALEKHIIEDAFNQLNTTDLVIGPAVDGGYYLLGLKKNEPRIFKNVAWSTDKVLNQTIKNAEQLNLSYTLLPLLRDIDTEEDWLHFNVKDLC